MTESKALFGGVESFDIINGDFDKYVERMEQYYVANDVEDDKKKVAIFITVVGKDAYTLLRSLLSPEKPNTKSFAEITKTLSEHFKPKRIIIAERYKFHERKQEIGESVNDFVAAIKKLSLHCEFGYFLNDALRDKLVCGIADIKVRKRLLVERDLTFEKATQIANAIEGAEMESRRMDAGKKFKVENEAEVFKLESRKLKCYRCDDETHLAIKCRFKNTICNKCNRAGHIARACRSKGSSKDKGNQIKFQSSSDSIEIKEKNNEKRDCNSEGKECNIEDEIFHIHALNTYSSKPYVVHLDVSGKSVKFEIDTGAGVTVISEETYLASFNHIPLEKSCVKIKTYTNEPIKVLGKMEAEVKHRGKTFKKLSMLVVTGCGVNLLGRDWLKYVVVDWKSINSQMLNNVHEYSNTVQPSIEKELNVILEKYGTMFEDRIGKINGYKAKIHLKKNQVPKFSKARSVPFALQDAVNSELERLENEGILKSVPFSDWASPIVIVPKPDGAVRICGDFKRTVNPIIENEVYPTPSNDEIFAKVQGGKKFSKIDLRQAYLQLELDDDAKKLLVINTNKGLKEFQRMANGIKPASAIFQKVIENILQGIPMVGVRTDDVLISGLNDEDHLRNIEAVLKALYALGVTIRKDKCKFFMAEVKNLGHIISKNGIRVDPEKTEAVKNAPQPTNVKELQSFIGAVNYYGKFIPDMATICKPLYMLLQKDIKWTWGKDQEGSFQALKDKLTSSPVLTVYDKNMPVILDCDASQYGLGAVISHVYSDGEERTIAYISRTLSKSELNYSQIDKEGAAIIFGIDKFKQYLFGRHFVLRSDNKALCKIFGSKGNIPVLAASRLTRWALILSMYDYDIQFRSTNRHCNADMLSRLPIKSAIPAAKMNKINQIQIDQLCVSAENVKEETEKDPQLSIVKNCLQNNEWLGNKNNIDNSYYMKRDELTLEDGIVMWGIRVVTPESLRKNILIELHKQHPGIVRMKSLARIHVWYPGIDKDIANMIRACVECKMVESNPPKIKNHPWRPASKPMDRVHLDFFGPFYGKMYFIMVDTYSKWCEVDIIRNIDANSTIDVCRQLFSRYGLPNQIITDNGGQFISDQFQRFCKNNGIIHLFTAPYHQSSNGQVERFVQTVKKGLKMNNIDEGDAQKKLNNFLFAYRVTPSTVTHKTPSELFLGRTIKSRIDNIKPNTAPQKMELINREPKREFEVGEKVFIRKYCSKEKWMSGTILKKIGELLYMVSVDGQSFRRHADQIIKNNTRVQDSKCSDDYIEYDFGSTIEADRAELIERPFFPRDRNEDRRYPLRDRRPVNRYGLS